jgi:hypothetical protein
VRQHQSRTLHLLDHLADDVGLAATGDAEQGLRAQPVLHALDELRDRRGLIARGLESRLEFERNLFHASSPRRNGWGPPRSLI